MTITRKEILKNDPPLQGTEVTVDIVADAALEDGGLSFGIYSLTLADGHVQISWGDGTSAVYESGSQIRHTYAAPGRYRIRISDEITTKPNGDTHCIVGTLTSGFT